MKLLYEAKYSWFSTSMRKWFSTKRTFPTFQEAVSFTLQEAATTNPLFIWRLSVNVKINAPPKWSALVRAIRKKHGLTQAHFANIVGASLPAVKSWESGKNPVSKKFASVILRMAAQ